MSKMLAAHQPNFIPWSGFFHKMAQADVFVLLDDVQVPKGRSYAYRTLIKTQMGENWLSVPLVRGATRKYRFQPLVSHNGWSNRIRKTLEQNYGKSAHWNYNDFLGAFANAVINTHYLAEFNTRLIAWARECLHIRTILVEHSTFGITSTKSRLMIDLCKTLGCDVYLSGTGAKAYNDPAEYEEQGIELRYQKFECPEYPQRWGEFIPNLSVVDLLFNCGPLAGEILCSLS